MSVTIGKVLSVPSAWWQPRRGTGAQAKEAAGQEFEPGQIHSASRGSRPSWAQQPTHLYPRVGPLMTLGQRTLYRVPGRPR
ncbi:hypothetical protein M2302_005962 [Micromonospora sp. A200]|uniref:hypothetical protein n=1 Tax=Micromonospora sp. A200 TaxID=2940568 RepID=UPI002474FDC6|nr:hypothetical protein [Micromonospora sp. A200]MDH6465760.1 hypothetical protein [Micromonospora sp. A200]